MSPETGGVLIKIPQSIVTYHGRKRGRILHTLLGVSTNETRDCLESPVLLVPSFLFFVLFVCYGFVDLF